MASTLSTRPSGQPLIHLFLLLCYLSSAGGQMPPPPDPVADANAVITQGPLRLTVLTPGLVRLELGGNSSGGGVTWDDRATLSVVNRRTPVPSLKVTRINATATRVDTAVLSVTLVGSGSGPGSKSTCTAPMENMDAGAPSRSPTYPNGTTAATIADCCALCDADAHCWATVYATDGSRMCYPLTSAGGSKPAVNRTLSNGGALPPGVSATISFTNPSGGKSEWTPATNANDPGNLNGTYTALDCYTTPMECDAVYRGSMRAGLLSTSGWTSLADTDTGRFVAAPDVPGGMPTWWTADKTDLLDVYFMAYPDLDYRHALRDWALVLGAPPMLPASAFGVWWSRYWPYTQETIVDEVLRGYANFSIPLNNLVFDMDWHNEPTDKTCQSWGNWDVNVTKFPDMLGFARMLHADGDGVIGNPLKLSFNIHPQTGVDHCDSRYPAIARAMGVDPATNATIPCDFGNSTYIDALLGLYMDASPLDEVDIWWSDYGGCGGPSPQLWNNRVLYDHMKYGRGLRGQAFSRYGGTGNHRYPHGFSGDTFQHEVVLAWEVKTTQTAANALWGYWSHDIGGFHSGKGCPGDADPSNSTGSELLLRWIQFGALAPVLRTHCDHCERRIWLFPHFELMRDAMRLRNALFPTLYTASRAFFDTAIAPLHPLYYDWPEDAAVYAPAVVEREYVFCDALIAAPITTMPGEPTSWPVYLPAGAWTNWNGTKTFVGPLTTSEVYGLGDVPLFARAGTLLALKTMSSVAAHADPLVWAALPGGAASGSFTLYEDDGTSDAYQGGEFVTTNASFVAAGVTFTLTVAPASVSGALFPGFTATRGHVLQLRGVGARPVASVTANGVPVPSAAPGVVPGWSVVPDAAHTLAEPAGALVVAAGAAFDAFQPLTVVVTFAS